MANYTLIANSQFKPFTYQDFLAPALMATQAHQELENQYSELATKANVWENLANEQTDPNAYKMYKTYADDLNMQAEQLAREGLNVTSRKNMLNMRNRYSKEIVPIEQAYKRRAELADEQRKTSLSNPTMFYQRNVSTISLDDFIKNPSLDYGKSYSGALLAQQVGQMATNLKTALTGKSRLKGIGLPYQYEQLLQYGYTPQQIQEAITNPQSGNPVLNTIVEQALNASGMKEWASPQQLREAIAYANQGLYNAIGKSEIKNFKDDFSMQNALAMAAEARQARQARQKEDVEGITPFNPQALGIQNLKNTDPLSSEISKIYNNFVYKDANGRYKLNAKGRQYIQGIADNYIVKAKYKGKVRYVMAKTGSNKIFYTNGTSKGDFEAAYSELLNNSRNYSPISQSEYDLGKRKLVPVNYTSKEYTTDFLLSRANRGAEDYTPIRVVPRLLNSLGIRGATDTVTLGTKIHNIYNNTGDVNLGTEYNYPIPSEMQGDFTGQLFSQYQNTPIYQAKLDPVTRKWKQGEAIDLGDIPLSGEGAYKIISVLPSSAGNTIMLQGGKGGNDYKRLIMPIYNKGNQNDMLRNSIAMEALSGMLRHGRHAKIKGNDYERDEAGNIKFEGRPLSPGEQEKYYQLYLQNTNSLASSVYGVVPSFSVEKYKIQQ